MQPLLFVLLSLSFLYDAVDNANILGIIPSPFYSHQATFRPLWKELARKGHNLTIVTTDLMEPNENISQIDLSGTYDVIKNHRNGSYSILKETNLIKKLDVFRDLANEIIVYQLTHPDLEPLKDPTKYHCDLIIVEAVHPWFFALGVKLGCPVIGVSSMDAFPWVHNFVGNAIHPSMYYQVDLMYNNPLSFLERLKNTAWTVMYKLLSLKVFPVFDWYVEEYIGKDLPKMTELHKSLSLLIVNANPAFYPIRPSTPVTVNIGGGAHLVKPKPLPKDLQDYLDQSKDGCIYFSLGSTINSNYLSRETIEIFRQTFEELAPMRVLWKYENETLENKPHNLEIRKWLPQHDVLRHPNVKVFITQGGLQSMEEAIDSAVPMLGMPFYGDQKNNVKKMSIKKFGIALDVATIDKKSLKDAILELVDNPLYKKNIEKLSAISKDQPMTGIEKAVWWTEYVLRHGGTEHLRSPSADIPLYQYFFLDIIAFVILVFIVLILLVYYLIKLIRTIFRLVFSKRNKVKTN
ncbi:hypothetical protein HHI36_007457 [Cryptolaemus montrouzieri]|uniref:UDP-glucuronosyltransferase n=1 Tax=Cryptolaemus montrouzieri TaxID=559131 RepID=A0ABD2MPN0_9CUCU